MMLTHRQEEALFIIASGYSIQECADMMSISRSSVEKLLQKAKSNLNAVNVRNAIYEAAKAGLIVFCCFAILDAEEVRRVSRSGRRELISVARLV